jgi:hypothetical protein
VLVRKDKRTEKMPGDSTYSRIDQVSSTYSLADDFVKKLGEEVTDVNLCRRHKDVDLCRRNKRSCWSFKSPAVTLENTLF